MFYNVARLVLPCLLVLGVSTAAVTSREVAGSEAQSNMQICSVGKNTGPGKRSCDFQGTLKKPAKSIPVNPGLTFEECRNTCLEDRQCKSFGYESDGAVCDLYTRYIVNQHPVAQMGSFAYWDRTCYDVKFYNEKALTNGGFNSGKLFPWKPTYVPETQNSQVFIVQPGYESNYAAQLSIDNTANSTGSDFNAFMTQYFFACPSAEYLFAWSQYQNEGQTVIPDSDCDSSITITINQPNGVAAIQTTFSIQENSVTDGDGNTYGAGNWLHFAVYFAPGGPGKFSVVFQINACPGGAESIQFDRISMNQVQSS